MKKDLRRTSTPEYQYYVDCETTSQNISKTEEKLYLSCFVARFDKNPSTKAAQTVTKYKRGESAIEFWDWLSESLPSGRRVWVYAHNWSFDAAHLQVATIPLSMGFIVKSYISNPIPFWMDLYHREKKTTVRLIDSLNYFRMPLSLLGSELGFEKGMMPTEVFNDSSREEWYDYCQRDVDLLAFSITMLQKELRDRLGSAWGNTLPSLAMSYYRRRHMKNRIYIHDVPAACKSERASYFGSRVEVFRLGPQRYRAHMLDYNSLYPACMAEGEFPVSLHSKSIDYTTTPEHLERCLEFYSPVALCHIRTDKPILPFRSDKLIFPTGEWVSWLAEPEIRLALKHKAIQKVYKIWLHRRAPIFKEFVHELYAYRRECIDSGKTVSAYIAKILLNSSYGRFALKGDKWTGISKSDPNEPFADVVYTHGEGITQYRQLFGIIQKKENWPESYSSYPLISSQIASMARVKLWETMEVAQPGHYMYCDTDSLCVDDEALVRLQKANMLHPSRLGALKLVNTSKSWNFRESKDYSFTEEKIKGVGKNAIQISENVYRKEIFESWGVRLKNGDDDGYSIIKTVDKHLSRKYTKSVVDPKSGWTTPRVIQCDCLLREVGLEPRLCRPHSRDLALPPTA